MGATYSRIAVNSSLGTGFSQWNRSELFCVYQTSGDTSASVLTSVMRNQKSESNASGLERDSPHGKTAILL
jgi:hypothetical protein